MHLVAGFAVFAFATATSGFTPSAVAAPVERTSAGDAVGAPRGAQPDWLDDAVVYGVSPWFFAGDNFPAVESRLEAIAKVGANVLWLSPVTEAPPHDFGYAVTNPFELRSTFGTDAEFRELLKEAHAHGLRVMLDAVTNHLAQQSPYFVDAERRGRRSPYYSWFAWDATGKPIHYFDWTNLENLNYSDPRVRDFTMAALAHWTADYPVDGLRLDAIWALRDRAPVWLALVGRNLKRINPQVVLLAEASALDPYYSTHGFDAAYDWTSQLGQWAWHDIFGKPGTTARLSELRTALQAKLEAAGGTGFKVLRFLNDNDTGRRFITQHGVQQARIAAVLLFTLPGVPLIYAGDEVGAEYEPYHMKRPIDWSDPYSLEPLYQRLVGLRHNSVSLRAGLMSFVATDHDDRVLAFVRGSRGGALGSGAYDPWMVVINFGPAPVTVHLGPATPLVQRTARWSTLNPLNGRAGKSVRGRSGRLQLQLPGYGALLLRPDSTQ